MTRLSIVGFVATVVGANWALATFGIVPIGFGLMAPAGVYFAGLTLTLRDAVREAGGKKAVVVAIIAGAALSYLLEDAQKFAIASGSAFLMSELADSAVYEPLRQRGRMVALATSNVVGLVVDSSLFLYLAFGSLEFIEGQLVGKLYMTGLAIGLLGGWRVVSLRRSAS